LDIANLVGFVLPPVIDLINRFIKNSNLRYLVSVLVCLLISGVINFKAVQGGSVDSLLTSFGLIFAEASSVYKLYWDKSAVRENLKLK